LNLPAPGKQF